MKMIDAQNGWVTGASSSGEKLYATSDGGVTWVEKFSTGPGGHIGAYDALDMQHVRASVYNNSGVAAAIARTNDGGATWETTDLSGQTLGDVDFVDPSNGFLGALSVTTDGGATWTSEAPPPIPGGPFIYFSYTDTHFVNVNHGWLVGSAGNNVNGMMGFILKRTVTE